jgi:hypothetical protein
VSTIRLEFRELFASVHHDEFDWDAWRPLYEEGWLPNDAVKQALSAQSNLIGHGPTTPSQSERISGLGFAQTLAVD